MEIRRVRDEELQAVGDLTVTAYVSGGFIPAAADYVDQLRDARSRAEQSEMWVAVEADRVLGAVAFCPEGSAYQEVARAGEGEFRMLAVAPEARGRGVGEALVRHCIARSRELGYDALALCTMEPMAAAQRIYERLGFQRVPDRDWEPVREVCLLGFRLQLD